MVILGRFRLDLEKLAHATLSTRRRSAGLGAGLLLLATACGGGGGGGGGDKAAPQAAAKAASSTTLGSVVPRSERVQACTLLTNAEIQAAIGSAPVGEGAPLAAAVPHICRWKLSGTGRTFAVAVNPASAVPTGADDAPAIKTTPVAGVGDKAEFWANTSQSSLVVHLGDTVISMACACPPTLPTQAKLAGLGQLVVNRLK